MAWFGFWARLTGVITFNIKAAGVAVILIFIPLYGVLGVGNSCVGAASACVVAAVVVGCAVLVVHLDGLHGWALHGGHVGLGGWPLPAGSGNYLAKPFGRMPQF